MTTKGIINGTPAYAIRSVRDIRYKLILNLNHESKFTNACTNQKNLYLWSPKPMQVILLRKELVRAYQHRPAVELYDLETGSPRDEKPCW